MLWRCQGVGDMEPRGDTPAGWEGYGRGVKVRGCCATMVADAGERAKREVAGGWAARRLLH